MQKSKELLQDPARYFLEKKAFLKVLIQGLVTEQNNEDKAFLKVLLQKGSPKAMHLSKRNVLKLFLKYAMEVYQGVGRIFSWKGHKVIPRIKNFSR